MKNDKPRIVTTILKTRRMAEIISRIDHHYFLSEDERGKKQFDRHFIDCSLPIYITFDTRKGLERRLRLSIGRIGSPRTHYSSEAPVEPINLNMGDFIRCINRYIQEENESNCNI